MNYPTRVISIESDQIKIRGNINHSIKARLFNELNTYELVNGDLIVSYKSTNIDAFKDLGLIETLIHIRDIGVPFGEDHKVIYSPAEFIRELINKGYRIGEFSTINGQNMLQHYSSNNFEI